MNQSFENLKVPNFPEFQELPDYLAKFAFIANMFKYANSHQKNLEFYLNNIKNSEIDRIVCPNGDAFSSINFQKSIIQKNKKSKRYSIPLDKYIINPKNKKQFINNIIIAIENQIKITIEFKNQLENQDFSNIYNYHKNYNGNNNILIYFNNNSTAHLDFSVFEFIQNELIKGIK